MLSILPTKLTDTETNKGPKLIGLMKEGWINNAYWWCTSPRKDHATVRFQLHTHYPVRFTHLQYAFPPIPLHKHNCFPLRGSKNSSHRGTEMDILYLLKEASTFFYDSGMPSIRRGPLNPLIIKIKIEWKLLSCSVELLVVFVSSTTCFSTMIPAYV